MHGQSVPKTTRQQYSKNSSFFQHSQLQKDKKGFQFIHKDHFKVKTSKQATKRVPLGHERKAKSKSTHYLSRQTTKKEHTHNHTTQFGKKPNLLQPFPFFNCTIATIHLWEASWYSSPPQSPLPFLNAMLMSNRNFRDKIQRARKDSCNKILVLLARMKDIVQKEYYWSKAHSMCRI